MTNQSATPRDSDLDPDRLRGPSMSNNTLRPASDFLRLETTSPTPSTAPSSHPATPLSTSVTPATAGAPSSSSTTTSTTTSATTTTTSTNSTNHQHHHRRQSSASPSPTSQATVNNNNNKRSADQSNPADYGHASSPKTRCSSRSPPLRHIKTRISPPPSPTPLDLYNRKTTRSDRDYAVGSPIGLHHHHHFANSNHPDPDDAKSVLDDRRSVTPDDLDDEDEEDEDDLMSNDVGE